MILFGVILKVNFYATFRILTGKKTVEIDLPVGTSIRDLVNRVITLFPDFTGQLLDDQGEMFRHIHVFINGRDTYYLPEGMETVLHQDEKIDIFPPVAGG
jgi:molybdopterin synthase sulfur carrier subunit